LIQGLTLLIYILHVHFVIMIVKEYQRLYDDDERLTCLCTLSSVSRTIKSTDKKITYRQIFSQTFVNNCLNSQPVKY